MRRGIPVIVRIREEFRFVIAHCDDHLLTGVEAVVRRPFEAKIVALKMPIAKRGPWNLQLSGQALNIMKGHESNRCRHV
jgi:hypothetical protein